MSDIKNPNHPPKGADLTQDPIRSVAAVRRIRANLKHQPRDLSYFLWGVNSAYRPCELLSLTCGRVAHLQLGNDFRLKMTKQDKHRTVFINKPILWATQRWLKVHPNPAPDAPLFISTTTGKALTRETMNKYVKRWCKEAGLHGKYGGYTLRKTWAHIGYDFLTDMTHDERIAYYQETFQHSHPSITRRYICRERPAVRRLYMEVELW